MTLKEWIEKNNTNYSDLSKIIGISKSHLSKISSGESIPSESVVLLIFQFTKGQVDMKHLRQKNPIKIKNDCRFDQPFYLGGKSSDQ